MLGMDPDLIHGLHVGTDQEAELRLSDIAALLDHIEAIRAENERLATLLVVAEAQLADMEWLSVEGFIDWKGTRRAALSGGQP